jgi:hypothetical protein
MGAHLREGASFHGGLYLPNSEAPSPVSGSRIRDRQEISRAYETQEECAKTIVAMWEYINQHEGSIPSPVPNGCIMRALMWLLRDDNLGSGKKEPIISEEIHWFLFFAKKFEDHSDCASSLIERHSSSEHTQTLMPHYSKHSVQ